MNDFTKCEIEWQFKPDLYKRPLSDNYDFWYDLTMGGYIELDKCLASINQIKILMDAIAIVESFQEALEELCCEDEDE